MLVERTLHKRVRDDADDGAPIFLFRRIELPNASPERAFVPEIFARETEIDDRDRLPGVTVFDREIAAFEHLQTEGGEIAIRDRLGVSTRPVALGHVIFSIDFVLAEVGESHAEPRGHGRALELRSSAQGAQSANEELLARFRGRVIAFEQSHPRGVNAALVVAVIDRGLVADRFYLEGGRDQERGGERDLADDENAGERVDQTAAVAAPAFFHDFGRISARAQQSRDKPGDDGREQRRADGEREHFGVDRERHPVRQRKGQRIGCANEQTDRPMRHDHADEGAERRDQKTFGQHLPHDPPARRTQRSANCQFLRPKRGPAELHVHDIDAGDEEHDQGRAEHGVNGLAQLRAGEAVQEREDFCGNELAVRLREFFRETTGQPDVFRVRLVDADVRF